MYEQTATVLSFDRPTRTDPDGTVEQAARDRFLSHLLCEGLADATTTQYVAMFVRWWRWAVADDDAVPDAPAAPAVRAWSHTLPPGVSTRDTAKATVRHWCTILGIDDVSRAVARPQLNTRNRRYPLSRAEAAALLDAADNAGLHGTAVYFGLYCGMRVSEIAKVRWDGIDFTARTVRFWRDKQDGWFEVPMHRTLAGHLEAVAQPHGFVFQAANLGHINKASIRNWIKAVGATAGLPDLQAHDLRRTAGRLVYDAGGRSDIIAAQQLLGHTKCSTTQLYLAATMDSVRGRFDEVDYR